MRRKGYGHGLPDARPDCVRVLSLTHSGPASQAAEASTISAIAAVPQTASPIPFPLMRSSPAHPTRPIRTGHAWFASSMQRSSTRSQPPGHCRRRGSSWRRRRPPIFCLDPLTEVTLFRRPAVRYQGDYNWSASQRLSVGYEWERETNPEVVGFDLDNNAVFAQHQSTFANRWFLTLGARRQQESDTTRLSAPSCQPADSRCRHRAGALSSVKVCSAMSADGVKSPTFTERFGGAGFAGSQSRHQGGAGKIRGPRRRGDSCRSETPCHGNCLPQRLHRSDFPSLRTDGRRDSEYINIDGSRASGLELELALQRPVVGLTAVGTLIRSHGKSSRTRARASSFNPVSPSCAGHATRALSARRITRPRNREFQPPNDWRPFRQQLSVSANRAERGTADGNDHRHHDQPGLRGRGALVWTFASGRV